MIIQKTSAQVPDCLCCYFSFRYCEIKVSSTNTVLVSNIYIYKEVGALRIYEVRYWLDLEYLNLVGRGAS